MKSRMMLAAILALGTSTAALAQVSVDVNPPNRGGVDVRVGEDAKVTTNTTAPTEAWVGRSVYSSDDKNLGEVAALSGNDIFVDIGGFLGIGETRVLMSNAQIRDVGDDRIVVSLTEEEAKALPAVDKSATAE